MRVFLLDTNIWSHWYRETDYVIANIAALKGEEHRLMMSPVSWGEFAYGWALDKSFSKNEFITFMNSISFQFCKELDKHAALIYGELRALLTEKYDPKHKNKKWLDALQQPTASKELGVQENDLWITSQAINLGATLATVDKKMERLLEIIPQKYIGTQDAGFCYQIWQDEDQA